MFWSTASADIDTTFMAIVGIKKITINDKSLSKWGSTRLRVSLVLDTTGSMASDGKIDALKTATKNLITQLQNAVTTDGDVYVSIIPFSKNIKVDYDYYTDSWIDWADWNSGTEYPEKFKFQAVQLGPDRAGLVLPVLHQQLRIPVHERASQ